MKKKPTRFADHSHATGRRPSPWPASVALLGLMLLGGQSHAIVISPVPLATASSVQAKPNIMFILDASGSMASSFMPDDAQAQSTEAYAYRASQCNGVAFDPSFDYTANLPKLADGVTSYPSITTLTRTPVDGFNTTASAIKGTSSTTLTIGKGSKTINTDDINHYEVVGLPVRIESTTDSSRWMQGFITSGSARRMVIDVTSSSGDGKSVTNWTVTLLREADLSGQYYYTYDNTIKGSTARMGWTYSTTGVDKTTDFYKQCTSAVGSTPGSTYFTKVAVSSLTGKKLEDYANWYAYFRTRIQLMRTAAGRAFAALDENYRVGFTTIDSTGVTDDANFHGINEFNPAQKKDFLTKLYERAPDSYTPLRAALSKVGRYYANKIAGQTDPVQYSCQRNYSILSTDGYWNANIEKGSFQAFQLDGTTLVGQQDGNVARPQYDGEMASSTVTKTWQRYEWEVNKNTGKNNCSRTTFDTKITPETMTETIVTVNGIVFSDTKSKWSSGTPVNYCYTANELKSRGISSDTSGNSTSGDTYIALTSTNPNGTLTSTSEPAATKTGGSSNSLADVAQYYYVNSLRDGNNDVPATDQDPATWQHMTTSTIGLGVSGTLTYDPGYLTQVSGDYVLLKQGTKDWPVPGDQKEAVNIDDLWHAAVNGRGRYFSALNASDLVSAISLSLSPAKNVKGAASAAATNSLKPVNGDNNQAFIATYTTDEWTGDVKAYPLNATTGVVDTAEGAEAWSAQTLLDAATPSGRTIYYRRPNGALQSFTYDNLTADGYGSNFSGFCDKTNNPQQCAGTTLSATQKALANTGANLVNYLRGDKTYTTKANPLYRERAHILGDIIGGAPAYVGKPPFSYTDTGYSDYKTKNANRPKMLYAAANDGMLHAFSAEMDPKIEKSLAPGVERWAFVPTKVLPKLYQLADAAYPTSHQYFVDGSPVVGDIKVGTDWKTILVGGLGAGGNGYYALDITDPTKPVALWEFTNTHLGLSFGNPIITKRADGTWVVVLASGYNNNDDGGDGRGHLFVLNANTGSVLLDLSTSAGSSSDPSGLAKINAWVEDPTNNTALRFYGGDLKGNLWRFDTDDLVGASGTEATLLGQFLLNSDPTTPQPITTGPQPVSVTSGNAHYPVVIVGTGSYLGSDDVGTTSQQSFYAIKDPLTDTGWGDVRPNTALVNRAITFEDANDNTGSIAAGTVDWATKIGWMLDLPKSGERVVTDMVVQYNTLAAVSAIPGSSVCTPSGGSSWLYLLDVGNGTAADSLPSASSALGAFLGVGITWLQTSNGDGKLEIVGSDGSVTTKGAGGSTPTPGSIRRTSWRELVD